MRESNRMFRRPHPFSRAALTAFGVFLAFVPGSSALAQSALPCRPGESLLSLGKAAFFRSIERGAFALGERTLDDLTDGLGEPASKQSTSSARGPRATAPARARAAIFPAATDAVLASALTAYVESPSSEASEAAFQGFLEAATKILFETPPEKPGEAGRVGLVLEGGQFTNRSSTFSVRDMATERGRLKLDEALFGGEADLQMGKLNKMLSAQPLFKAPVIADTRNADRNNLGITVKKEQDLRSLWFEDYRSHLAAATPPPSTAQITEALNAGWPVLQKFWAFKRTEIFLDRAQTVFGTELREVNERATRENLPARDCQTKAR